MNTVKIQQDLLKSANDRDGYKHKIFEFNWYQNEENVFFCFKYGIYVIPCNKFYLDAHKVFDNEPFTGVAKIVESQKEALHAVDTKMLISHGKKTLHVFKVKDEEIWVNEKYLKMFDMNVATFKGTNKKSPVFIYEFDELVGIVLPVNH